MEELKPCPFCGSEAHIQTFHFRYRVGCGTTGCIAGRFNRAFDTPEEAAAAWNRRAERTCQMSVADNGAYRCSECGHLQDDTYRSDKGWYPPEYCAHCGARVMSE